MSSGGITDFDVVRANTFLFRAGGGAVETVSLGIAASPSISTNVAYLFLARGGTIVAIQGYANGVPLGSSTNLTLDININGVTIYTNQAHRLIWPTSAHLSSSTPPDVTTIPDGAVISLDIDQISSDGAHPGGPGIYVSIAIAREFES